MRSNSSNRIIYGMYIFLFICLLLKGFLLKFYFLEKSEKKCIFIYKNKLHKGVFEQAQTLKEKRILILMLLI